MTTVQASITAICPFCNKENQEWPLPERHCIHYSHYYPMKQEFEFWEIREGFKREVQI